jgi:hypothetical protein
MNTNDPQAAASWVFGHNFDPARYAQFTLDDCVYVAVAIMLAHPDDYFVFPDRYYVGGSGGRMGLGYHDALQFLVAQLGHDADSTHLMLVSKRLQLHGDLPLPAITLTPPAELLALVRAAGVTPAVAVLQQRTIDAVVAHGRLLDEGQRTYVARQRQLAMAAAAIVERLRQEYGDEFEDLADALRTKLAEA